MASDYLEKAKEAEAFIKEIKDHEYYHFKSLEEDEDLDLIDRNKLKIAFIYSGIFDNMKISKMRKIFDVIDSVDSIRDNED